MTDIDKGKQSTVSSRLNLNVDMDTFFRNTRIIAHGSFESLFEYYLQEETHVMTHYHVIFRTSDMVSLMLKAYLIWNNLIFHEFNYFFSPIFH